jgi:hypothetical protein
VVNNNTNKNILIAIAGILSERFVLNLAVNGYIYYNTRASNVNFSI